MRRPASPADLPAAVPVFPLSGGLLLPFSQRPLNIFEPRYIKMIDRVLGTDRLIGLVQPEDTTEESPQGKVPLRRIGMPRPHHPLRGSRATSATSSSSMASPASSSATSSR